MPIKLLRNQSKLIINLGNSLEIKDLDNLFQVLNQARSQISKNDDLIFNFSDLKFISPSAAVVIMAAKNELTTKCNNTIARIKKKNVATKFMSALGLLNFTVPIDEYMKSISKYVVEIEACKSFTKCQDIGSEIVEKIKQRSNCTTSTIKAINYMIDEIADNAGSHGYECYDKDTFPGPVYMTAFSYSDRVEIAILDRGLGIHRHLTKVDKYKSLSAKEALSLAIKDKVSGHPSKSPGYGLFSASQFTSKRNGEMYIWSSSRNLVWKNSKAKIYPGNLKVGTLITFLVFKDVDIPFDSIVSEVTSDNYDYIFGDI